MYQLVSKFLLLPIFISGQLMAAEFYPLQVGNQWKYIVHANPEYEMVNEVLDKVVVDKVTWYKLKEFEDIYWVRSGENGQLEAMNWAGMEKTDSSPVEEILVYSFPLHKSTLYDAGEDTIAVYLPAQTVKTAAGEFKCIMYQIGLDKKNHTKNCVAEGVGIVWSDLITEGESEVAELVEFKLKSAN